MDGSERSVARLRLVAAAVVGVGAVWLALLGPPPAGWLCVVGGLGASIMWLVMAFRARRRTADADRQRLVLGPDGLALVEGARERTVPWDAVDAVEIDEERLVVRVLVRGEEPVAIEPRYGGLGAYDLREAIRRAWDAGSDRDPGHG